MEPDDVDYRAPTPGYAVAGALTDDAVFGLVPGHQVGPFLAALDRLGWMVVEKDVGAVGDNPPSGRIEAQADWMDTETRSKRSERKRARLLSERHYANGKRVWCPPMCPNQRTPRPGTARGRRRLIRSWKRDGSYRDH